MGRGLTALSSERRVLGDSVASSPTQLFGASWL